MNLVLSDIHGNLEALDAVLSDATKRCDKFYKVIILGDTVDYGADSVEVVRRLRSFVEDTSRCDIFYCVRGNHEEALNRDKSDFRTEHAKVNFEITKRDLESLEGKDLEFYEKLSSKSPIFNSTAGLVGVFCHGYVNDYLKGSPGKIDILRIRNPESYSIRRDKKTSVILGGHSHIQGFLLNDSTFVKTLYINPGSVGQPRNGDPRAQYLIVDDDFSHFCFKRVSYDIEKAAKKIIDSGRPKFLATRLFLGI